MSAKGADARSVLREFLSRRRFLAPEVIQTSALDCGPAALKCLLEGFYIPVSYGRLREACHTGIDGTSIDTMEAVANQLGLQAEQIMIPADHVMLPEARALPALVVVQLPNGITHFVIAWRRVGSMLQIMDPAAGRRWVLEKQFLKDVYRHRIAVGAEDWREFAISAEFQIALKARLRLAGVPGSAAARLLQNASRDPSWEKIAALDAAARFVTTLANAGSVPGGNGCTALVEQFLETPPLIPERFWSVKSQSRDSNGAEQILMSGAVLIRIKGRQSFRCRSAPQLSPELAAAVSEKRLSPARHLFSALWRSGRFGVAVLLLSLLGAAAGTVFEAMLFRVLLDVSSELGLRGQRMGAAFAVLLFGAALLLLELPAFAIGTRLGRQIEVRLRLAFLEKIPRLGDRYFRSRLISDMAERSHVTHRLRHLPDQVRQMIRAVFELGTTAAAIVWLAPAGLPWVLGITACALVPAVLTQPMLAERDLRVRTHAGGLMRFFLDAMIGLVAIRSHGAERNIRRDQDMLLGGWAEAGRRLQRTAVAIEAIQLVAIYALVAGLLLARPAQGSDIGGVLLLVYWTLNLPVLGQDIASLARQYPYYRNVTLRLLEPLGAPEESVQRSGSSSEPIESAPRIEFRDVNVQISEHTILEGIQLFVKAGSHLAIVGPSGAGKSSIVALLLGWLTPASGQILVNGEPLDCERIRRFTAWVDPAVQLWNRSFAANLAYGNSPSGQELGHAVDAALLRNVLENLPHGMQTPLGEGGALVSGGEGQRVRLARALLRKNTRLVILDEPFRGLDREKRRELLKRARDFWRDCTLICITHDLSETASFDEVAVVEGGRVIEHGSPRELMANSSSRYSALLEAEDRARAALWAGSFWRRVHVHNGRIAEDVSRHNEESRREAEVA